MVGQRPSLGDEGSVSTPPTREDRDASWSLRPRGEDKPSNSLGLSLRDRPAPAAGSAPVASAPAPTADDPEARLAKLKALLDKGLVTQADYDSAKAEIIKKLIGTRSS